MLLNILVFPSLILVFELVSSVECGCTDDKITCFCGDSHKTVSISCIDNDQHDDPCEAYEHCETCEDDVAHCLTCPRGHSGPFCHHEHSSDSWDDDSDSFHNDKTGNRLVPRDLNCPNLAAPKLGFIRCWYQQYEKECTGRCLPGHSFESGETEITLSCQSGVWLPRSSFPPCLSQGYCKIEMNFGGYFNCTIGGRGTHCDITCNSRGYRPTFGRYYCYPGEQWDPPLPYCVKEEETEPKRNEVRNCPDPGQVANGIRRNLNERQLLQKPQYYVGSRVIFSCNDGFALIGESMLTCLASGKWSSSLPTCQSVTTESTNFGMTYCKDPGVDPNGIKTVSPWINPRKPNRNSKEVEYPQGTEIEYSCKEGYDLQGETSLLCRYSGYWSSSVPTCQAKFTPVPRTTEEDLVYCKDPGVDPNGIKTVSIWLDARKPAPDSDETQYPQGTKINYSCKEGYEIEGEVAIICLYNGHWSSPTPKCREIPFAHIREAYCKNPGEIPNGWKTVPTLVDPKTNRDVLEDSDEFPPGSRLIIYCNPGFTIRGSETIECTETGTWSSAVPTCEEQSSRQLQGCGHSYVTLTGKILHGDRTVEGEWPWQIAYAENRRYGMTITCGAILISPNTALTAAHCVLPRRLDRTFLYFGKFHSDFSKDSKEVLQRKATQFIIHPRYNRGAQYNNDIAMVRFSPDVPYNKRIQPICLPTPDTTSSDLQSGTQGYVTGWGTTENRTDSDVLLIAQLPVVSKVECQQTYRRENLDVQITDNMFCAGYKDGGADSCTGDSGGPMVFFNSRTKTYVLEGIVSFGVKGPTGSCGQKNRYGVYTRVSNYVTWIQRYI